MEQIVSVSNSSLQEPETIHLWQLGQHTFKRLKTTTVDYKTSISAHEHKQLKKAKNDHGADFSAAMITLFRNISEQMKHQRHYWFIDEASVKAYQTKHIYYDMLGKFIKAGDKAADYYFEVLAKIETNTISGANKLIMLQEMFRENFTNSTCSFKLMDAIGAQKIEVGIFSKKSRI